MHRFILTILFAFAVGVSGSKAATLVNGTGLASPAAVVDFDGAGLTAGAIVTNQFASQGVTFGPNLYFNSQGPVSFPGISGDYLANFNPLVNPFSLLFAMDQTDVAFGFATNVANTTLTAFLNGVIVESFQTPTTSNNAGTAFLGFTGILFDEIQISVSSSLALVDNIQLGTVAPVPLPAALPLLLAALAGAGLLGWRGRPRA